MHHEFSVRLEIAYAAESLKVGGANSCYFMGTVSIWGVGASGGIPPRKISAI